MLHSQWFQVTPTFSTCVDNWGNDWHRVHLENGYTVISTTRYIGLPTDPHTSMTGLYPAIEQAFELYLAASHGIYE